MQTDNSPAHPPSMPLYSVSLWGTPAFLDPQLLGYLPDSLWAGEVCKAVGGPQAGGRSRAVRGIGTPPSSLKFRAQAPAAPERGTQGRVGGGEAEQCQIQRLWV